MGKSVAVEVLQKALQDAETDYDEVRKETEHDIFKGREAQAKLDAANEKRKSLRLAIEKVS